MKRYVLFAGVNGAGKTTLYQTNTDIQKLPRVNLDEIVRKAGNWKNQKDVSLAGREAVRLIREFFSKGISFNQETTLCGKSILRNIRMAKELGYKIEMFFVVLETPDLAIDRVHYRVQAGGHGIPEKDIKRRYYESLRNLCEIMPVCDHIELYDNTEFFRHITTFEYGKCIEIDKVVPNWFRTLFQNL